MEQLVWELFKKTGNIKYYLLAKKIGEDNAVNKNNGNNSKWN